MPLPVTTAMLAAAAILAGFPYAATRILTYVLVGLSVANEGLRMVATRPPASAGGQYQIPAIPRAPDAAPRRERTPIRYDDGEA